MRCTSHNDATTMRGTVTSLLLNPRERHWESKYFQVNTWPVCVDPQWSLVMVDEK